ncbi:MAG TPA: hypothetical protein VMH23_17745, partial [Bacteroidota bacterium]|nr:hypothetical protein [Bacteroidota bacterium]
GKSVFLVNAFAANDPDSTLEIYNKVARVLRANPSSFLGLLNLRDDRPDRTLQWIETLKDGWSSSFKTIFVLDGHSRVVRRRIDAVEELKREDPRRMTESAVARMADGDILFGFGNIGGAGRQLVDHWQEIGEEYGI